MTIMDFNHILLKINKVNYYKKWDILNYSLISRKDKIIELKQGVIDSDLISIIIPINSGNISSLKKTIESVINQSIIKWELIIICNTIHRLKIIKYFNILNNSRVKFIISNNNENILNKINSGIKISSGSYITILKEYDHLDYYFLEDVYQAISKYNPDLTYVDEDYQKHSIIGSLLITPKFKPDYSSELLLSFNYIDNGVIYSRSLINHIGLFNQSKYAEYEYILKCSEYADTICHIRKVLYHHVDTYQKNDSKKYMSKRENIIKESLIRKNRIGEVIPYQNGELIRIKYSLKQLSHITIIIPFKDKSILLDKCINSIIQNTTYPFYDILLIDNLSKEQKTREIIHKWVNNYLNITCINYSFAFNYSKINNFGVSKALGEYIVLMNNDIEIITPTWIESLLEYAQHEEIGAVGAKLYYPNGMIQHAGIAMGVGGLAGHPYCKYPSYEKGYNYDLITTKNVAAVTGALLMVQKQKYCNIGGLDEKNLPIAFNDVDFCLRLLEKGYQNIFTPFCEATHGESLSRGSDNTPEKLERFNSEIRYCLNRHKLILQAGDPWYNPNYSMENSFMRITQHPSNEKRFGIYIKTQNNLNNS